MRARLVRLPLLALLAAFLLVPLAGADQAQGSTVGVDLGFLAPGLWDVYSVPAPAILDLTLTWAPAVVFPWADYDLHLYRPGAFDDGYLAQGEMVTLSAQKPFAHHHETISHPTTPGARYVVAVVPYQTQMETYTLSANGPLRFEGTAAGYVTYGR